jgi:hypothetical protein
MTGKQMCEYIADVWFRALGKRINPMDIWNMESHGELWPIVYWYNVAKAVDAEMSKADG